MPALLSATLPTLFQTGMGIYDLIRSSQYANKERPERKTPLALDQRIQGLENLASTSKMPGQSQMEEDLTQMLSEQLSSIESYAGSSIDAIGALNQASRGARSVQRDISIKGAQNQQNNYMNYMNALNDLANDQNFQWQYNEAAPYAESMSAASKLQESGIKNLFSGVSDMSSLFSGSTKEVDSTNNEGGGKADYNVFLDILNKADKK